MKPINHFINLTKLICCKVLSVVYLLLLANVSLADETTLIIPDTPAGKRVQESLRIIDTGDIAQIKDYIATQFKPSFFKIFDQERIFSVYYGFHEKYGGLEFHKIVESSPYKFIAVFRCRNTESAYEFGLAVLSRSPHLIQGITIRPMTDPDQPESIKSLTEEERVARLESFLDILGTSEIFSGAVLLARNGKIILQKAYGYSNREKSVNNQVNTRFNLASINKMFTAVAVAQLCEREKMSYEDPISTYLGIDWLSSKVANKVQVKHLLSHTSGIAISKGDDNLKYLEESISKKYRRIDDYKVLTEGAFLKTKPGKEYSYSNIGFDLLGPVIEKVSGEGYYQYIQEHIFNIAGMDDTAFDELDHLQANTAIGYVKQQKDGKISWTSNEANCMWRGTPSGSGYSTVGDLLKFEQALKNNLLVSRITRDILFTPKTELGARSYGFGFEVRQFNEQLEVGHTGGYIGINNQFSMYVNNGYTVIILSNIDLISGSSVSDIEFYITGLFF